MTAPKRYKATIAFPAFSGKMNLIFNEWMERSQNADSEFIQSDQLGCGCCYSEFKIETTFENIKSLPEYFYTYNEAWISSPMNNDHVVPSEPKVLAKKFAKGLGYPEHEFDFSILSLSHIDGLLEHWMKYNSRAEVLEPYISAYVGETLLKKYPGAWDGQLYLHGIPNYYSCHLRIGSLTYFPSRYFEYFMNSKDGRPDFYQRLTADFKPSMHDSDFDVSITGLISRLEKLQF